MLQLFAKKGYKKPGLICSSFEKGYRPGFYFLGCCDVFTNAPQDPTWFHFETSTVYLKDICCCREVSDTHPGMRFTRPHPDVSNRYQRPLTKERLKFNSNFVTKQKKLTWITNHASLNFTHYVLTLRYYHYIIVTKQAEISKAQLEHGRYVLVLIKCYQHLFEPPISKRCRSDSVFIFRLSLWIY